ncbi:hemolysin-III related domain-containing protein [Ditylenchus destructor]|nr:hemolysin-III related domain-containing protein [Ditylenchus destructor]
MRSRCIHCTYASYCCRHAYIRLVNKESLKPCMWINKHIHTNYRPTDLPWTLCVKSIFQWNNETINVWSHLLGFFYLCLMQYWNICHFLPNINAHPMDYVITAISMLCSQICMVLSSAYHTFGCQSASRRRKWLKADLFGVSTGLFGIYLTGIYTSFYRFPEVQRVYICSLVVILAISLCPLLIPFGHEPSNGKQKSSRLIPAVPQRRIGPVHCIYVGLALFGLYPAWHWVELHGGLSSPHVEKWLPSLVILFALVGMAFVFYATLIPERFFPGQFDVVGCSHQWWHLLILAAMVYWHWAGIDLLTDHIHFLDPRNKVGLYIKQTMTNSLTKFQLVSKDGQKFEVDLDVIRQSTTLNNMFNELGMDGFNADDVNDPIPLPNINGAMLKKIVEWCIYHKDDPPLTEERECEMRSKPIPHWDAQFLKLDQNAFFELVIAANYLDVPSLSHALNRAIRDMIYDKSADEIRVMFNIRNDFGLEEDISESAENAEH